MMQLAHRIRAMERLRDRQLNGAIERELARFTPEQREKFLREFAAEYEREHGYPPWAARPRP